MMMTPNKKSSQPFFNILLSFHVRGFVLVGKKIITRSKVHYVEKQIHADSKYKVAAVLRRRRG